jgi:hypothetical protein
MKKNCGSAKLQPDLDALISIPICGRLYPQDGGLETAWRFQSFNDPLTITAKRTARDGQ